MNIKGIRLDWKVGSVLIVGGALLWVVTRQPLVLGAILPLLFLLACPLGMGLMMFFMMRGMGNISPPSTAVPPSLNVEDASRRPLTRSEQLADLHEQLAQAQAQQQVLAQQLAEKERETQTTPR